MSWFIFNNVHSDDMGIIVESLPPIVLPPKRYNLIEIDGREITEIEDLGYKAYEKQIPIGLKGDINLAVNHLRGEGKLILSDEPDRYYDAVILDQLDYMRLLKFRTATIPFIVQPYKYSIYEDETTSRMVINQGNVESLPRMNIYGNGAVVLSVNGKETCRVNVNGHITVDSQEQEVYKGTVRQNRQMQGEFPKLAPGINEITATGSVSEIKTLVRSRWL